MVVAEVAATCCHKVDATPSMDAAIRSPKMTCVTVLEGNGFTSRSLPAWSYSAFQPGNVSKSAIESPTNDIKITLDAEVSAV